jgi:hypothetical protein
MGATTTLRLGGGAGYETDWIEPAVVLAERGNLDYLCFETLAERTLALAQRRRQADPRDGFNPTLVARMRACLPPCVRNGVRVIGNFGAANPPAATDRLAALAAEMGYPGLKIATVTGDDVRDALEPDLPIWETGQTLADLPGELVAANAYLGVEPIVEALAAGADIIVTGRVADPALFLAPMVHEFGWPLDDWRRLGQGTVVGHLLECSAYVTGGNYLDPGFTEHVPDLASIGFPIGEVAPDGTAVITKVSGTGGLVTPLTCKAQLVYEIGDPARYLTPDVVADFRGVRLEADGRDRVRVCGGGGNARPDSLKVSVAIEDGFIGESEVAWGGPGALAKARAMAEAVERKLAPLRNILEDLRFDLVGVNSILGAAAPEPAAEPNEVRLRVAARSREESAARAVAGTFRDFVMVAPLGAGAERSGVRKVIGLYSTTLPRERVCPKVEIRTVGGALA